MLPILRLDLDAVKGSSVDPTLYINIKSGLHSLSELNDFYGLLLTTLNRLTAHGCLKYCFNGLNLKMDLHRHMSSTQCAQCVCFIKLLQYKGSCLSLYIASSCTSYAIRGFCRADKYIY